jgi:hypothetical protein
MLTAALYLRIPADLRGKLDDINSRLHNGYPRRGDLADTAIRALQAGLEVLLAPISHADKLKQLNAARAPKKRRSKR